MSIRELYEWYEYYSEEPFMADRLEIQLATLSVLAGGFGGSKLKHKDYMIRKQEEKTQSKEEYQNSLKNAFKNI